MPEQMMSVNDLAVACETCRRCGAALNELCATAMKRAAEAAGDETAVRELAELERAGAQLVHPERLADVEERIDSAVAYGLVVRVIPGKEPR